MTFKKILLSISVYILVSVSMVAPMSYTNFNNPSLISYAMEGDEQFSISINYQDTSNTCSIIGYNGTDTNVIIPSTITDIDSNLTYTVTQINGLNSNITDVTIPNTVTTINENAFQNYQNLKTVTFEDGSKLQTIGMGAFYGCTKLNEINLDCATELQSIGSQAFFKNNALKQVTISSEDITTIGAKALGFQSSNQVVDGFAINCYSYNKDIITNYVGDNAININILDDIDELKQCSIALDGNVGIDFYINFSNATLNDDNAKMVFNTPNGNVEVPKSQWVFNETNQSYKFTIYIDSKMMDYTVTASLSTSNDNVTIEECSVNSCINSIKSNPNSEDDLINLATAMQYYGICSNAYLNDGTLSEDEKTYLDTAFGDTQLQDYAYIKDGSLSNISYHSSAIILNQNIDIRHYLNIPDNFDLSNYSIRAYSYSTNESIPIETGFLNNNQILYISLVGIQSYNFDEFYILEITNPSLNERYTIKYSVLSYVNAVLRTTNTSIENLETLKYLMKSLYLYSHMSDIYFETV
ncbi:MAG: leucine-rich repeat domain-containing protein [Oscillospiraceae bacterium]